MSKSKLKQHTTMPIINCLFSPTLEIQRGFSVWFVPPRADNCQTTQLPIAETASLSNDEKQK
jgi:hypothetical protein